MKHTVAIVDDHLLIAKALSGIIDTFEDYQVLYEVGHGKELQDKMKLDRNIPDIVLLDVSMPVMDGFETAQWLKKTHPAVEVMALSMQDDDATLMKMIKCGAQGYLHKNVHPVELKNALDTLLAKRFYFPEWVTNRILHNMRTDEQPDTELKVKLTDRETDFLRHACTELTYKEIGEKMFVSPRTVESYRDALFEKLGLKTRVGLVMYAIKIGLVQNVIG